MRINLHIIEFGKALTIDADPDMLCEEVISQLIDAGIIPPADINTYRFSYNGMRRGIVLESKDTLRANGVTEDDTLLLTSSIPFPDFEIGYFDISTGEHRCCPTSMRSYCWSPIDILLSLNLIKVPMEGWGYTYRLENRASPDKFDMYATFRENSIHPDDKLVLSVEPGGYSPRPLSVALLSTGKVYSANVDFGVRGEQLLNHLHDTMQLPPPPKGSKATLRFLDQTPLDLSKSMRENGVKEQSLLVLSYDS